MAAKINSWQPAANQIGIPQWLEQFLNSQGGLQGLLYSVGGIQGLISLIQQQSQQPSGKPTPQPGKPGDPFGWADWLTENHPPAAWQPGKTFQGRVVTGPNPNPQVGDITFQNAASAAAGRLDPYYYGRPQLSNVDDWSRTMSPEEIAQFRAIPAGTRGDALLQYLPERFRNTPEALTMARLGNNPDIPNGDFSIDPRRLTGVSGGSALKPMPLHKYDYAGMYGYGSKAAGAPQFRPNQWLDDRSAQYRSQTQRTPMGPDTGNILQTLRGAGWDPSKGYGPQTFAGAGDKQQTMLNDLLYSISPRNRPASEYDYMGSGMSREAWLKDREERNKLPKAPDPFEGLQSAINRDAYVNETLGGGFYGGIIPDEDAINTFGNRHIGGDQDPHFPTPQLALNPLPGQNRFDTYAGWAADQGAAFGTAPWASDSMWGQSMGYDDPTKYQQPPAPTTAWQPTPQFGQNTWSGTKGWGNTSRNQQNQNAWGNSSTQQQQQPMSFGVSPWDNPWGMRT